ncbi:hypothetical protein DPMN_148905 [Dreissena polymorpha]|nr:hypothetical protein DPMN_148905 [Dreissena polymorpha]
MLKHHINEHSNKALDKNTRVTTHDTSHKAVNCTNASFESNQMQNLATPEDARMNIRQETTVKQRKRDDINLNITLMVFLMAITSFVRMMPHCVLALVSRLRRDENPWWIAMWAGAVAINSSVNPFIIGFCNSEFRVYVKNVFR